VDPLEFWRIALDELADVEPRSQLAYVEQFSTADVAVYNLAFQSLDDVRVGGWLALPRRPGEPRCAGLLTAPGYIADPVVPVEWATRGYAALSLAYRGKAGARSRVSPAFPGYVTEGLDSPESTIYRGVYMDAVRALDLLAAHPGADPTRIGIRAVSQGAGVLLAAAALRPKSVAAIAVGCPFLVDIPTGVRLAANGPYEEIAAQPDSMDRWADALKIIDVMGLAGEIVAPMYLHLGANDTMCPPSTGYAFADALRGPVELASFEGCGHGAGSRSAEERARQFLAEKLVPKAPLPPPRPSFAVTLPHPGESSRRRSELLDSIDQSLANLPVEVVRHRVPSVRAVHAWRLHYRGEDGCSLTAELTMPVDEAPQAVIVQLPRYGSVNLAPDRTLREAHVTFTPSHRGQLASDPETDYRFPGTFRTAALGPEKFAYRAVLSDVLRALDILIAQPGIAGLPVGVYGDDLGLFVAARRRTVTALRVDALVLTGASTAAQGPVAEWQMGELSAAERDAVASTYAVFDPLAVASSIDIPVLVSAGDDDDAHAVASVLSALQHGQLFSLSGRDYLDEAATRHWIVDSLLRPNP